MNIGIKISLIVLWIWILTCVGTWRTIREFDAIYPLPMIKMGIPAMVYKVDCRIRYVEVHVHVGHSIVMEQNNCRPANLKRFTWATFKTKPTGVESNAKAQGMFR